MHEETIKCEHDKGCMNDAIKHANFTLWSSSGFLGEKTTYHFNYCNRHLAQAQTQYSGVKVFEIGECNDENCVAGKLPRLSDTQE